MPEPESPLDPPPGTPPDAPLPEAAPPDAPPETSPPKTRTSAASTVAAGIFLSRIFGFVRTSALAYFFGAGAHYDVYVYATRGPNLLQNLLGEGTLSAAFIPIYSRMIAEGRQEEAGRFAGAIFGLLVVVVSALVLLGVTLARPIASVLAYGLLDDAAQVAAGQLPVDRFELVVQALRIVFPMSGLFVLSAWALGVLNSHRRFFLPYFAPVLWNLATLTGLFGAAYFLLDNPLGLSGPGDLRPSVKTRILFAAFMGALLGGALQFLVQLPLVAREMTGFKLSVSTKVTGVREAIRAFGPVVAGRGVSQISSYLDIFLAGLLAAGAPSALGFAQIFYFLPISLFGMSVAASELPELSRIGQGRLAAFLGRIDRSMRQMLLLTIPTIAGYLGFGFLIVKLLLQRGSFSLNDNWLVYAVLGAYTLGLLATTISRLLQNAFYALNDTRTPARIAVLRVAVSGVVAVPLMFFLDRFSVSDTLGFAPAGAALYFGAVGLALGATAGAWVELWRLTASLKARVPSFTLPWNRIFRMTGLALIALGPAALLWWLLAGWPTLLITPLVVGTYAATYLALATLAGFPETKAWTGRLLGRLGT